MQVHRNVHSSGFSGLHSASTQSPFANTGVPMKNTHTAILIIEASEVLIVDSEMSDHGEFIGRRGPSGVIQVSHRSRFELKQRRPQRQHDGCENQENRTQNHKSRKDEDETLTASLLVRRFVHDGLFYETLAQGGFLFNITQTDEGVFGYRYLGDERVAKLFLFWILKMNGG